MRYNNIKQWNCDRDRKWDNLTDKKKQGFWYWFILDIATKLNNENLDEKYFSASIGLKGEFNRPGLTGEEAQSILTEINEHCFKKGIEIKEFVTKWMDFLQFQTIKTCRYIIFNSILHWWKNKISI